MTEQRHLFPMPKVIEFDLTVTQRRVLDWVAYNEDRLTAFPPNRSRYSLRSLIRRKLVMCTAHSPGRYRLTELGRLVRAQLPAPKERESMVFTRALAFED